MRSGFFAFSAVALLYLCLCLVSPATARVVEGIKSSGTCAIVNMSPERCRQVALQQARADAIAQAAGIRVEQAQIVTDMRLAADFIKTYSRGYIVREEVISWHLGSYQADKKTVPIPEYRVEIQADVALPERKVKPIGLAAELCQTVFRSGEKASIRVKTSRTARVGIFAIDAGDRVTRIFPNAYEGANTVGPDAPLVFPRPDCKIEIEMRPMPGQTESAEFFFVIAVDESAGLDIEKYFAEGPVGLTEFFGRYAGVSEQAEDQALPYLVVEGR